MPATTLGPHTVKDWLATPEGERWELIHGNLVMTQETEGNRRLASEIEWRIRSYFETCPLGIVEREVAFYFPEILDADREGVVPDLCFIPNDQLDKVDSEANAQEGVIPALMVGILSPSTREIDLVDKVEIYREAGVREYWIFDRHEETVTIYRFAEDPEKPVAIQSFDNALSSPLFPGFSLALPRIRESLAIGRRRRGLR